MHAIVKILPVNYIMKDNWLKFSVANNLYYTVTGTSGGLQLGGASTGGLKLGTSKALSYS